MTFIILHNFKRSDFFDTVIIFLNSYVSELFMVYNVYLGFFDKHGWKYWWLKQVSTHCKHVPCNTLTHSTNEDLLNIKRKGDSEVLYPLSYVRYHWNPEPVCNKSHVVSLFYLYWYFFNLLNLFWHTDKNFCFYAEVNFWDFVRNNSSIEWD